MLASRLSRRPVLAGTAAAAALTTVPGVTAKANAAEAPACRRRNAANGRGIQYGEQA
jgi:hypothetical protein